MYQRIFDAKLNRAGKKDDMKYNHMFIKSVQQYSNDLLKANGCVLLNDIYKFLELPLSREGMTNGYFGTKEIDFHIVVLDRNRFSLTFETIDISKFFKKENEL